ncbi:tyrosine-protein kinase transmembrane receptor ROR2-like [Orbicella faveolata]|nr:tyrosine-protein kinase transmembrane receptor ROR2-like [Orbicella faveolata]
MSEETLLPIRWLSPEALMYGKFTVGSDVYAYGVVLWEIFTFGLQPYYGYTNKEVMGFIQKGIQLGRPDNCPDFIFAVMKDCWWEDPDERLEFSEIETRLNNPLHSYDMVVSASDSEEGGEHLDAERSDTGNSDIPRATPSTSDYDIPATTFTSVDGNYDVPRSSEYVHNENADENSGKERDVPNDFAV